MVSCNHSWDESFVCSDFMVFRNKRMLENFTKIFEIYLTKIIVFNFNEIFNKRKLIMSNFGLMLTKYFLFGPVIALNL